MQAWKLLQRINDRLWSWNPTTDIVLDAIVNPSSPHKRRVLEYSTDFKTVAQDTPLFVFEDMEEGWRWARGGRVHYVEMWRVEADAVRSFQPDDLNWVKQEWGAHPEDFHLFSLAGTVQLLERVK
jgi:hypothetical protein